MCLAICYPANVSDLLFVSGYLLPLLLFQICFLLSGYLLPLLLFLDLFLCVWLPATPGCCFMTFSLCLTTSNPWLLFQICFFVSGYRLPMLLFQICYLCLATCYLCCCFRTVSLCLTTCYPCSCFRSVSLCLATCYPCFSSLVSTPSCFTDFGNRWEHSQTLTHTHTHSHTDRQLHQILITKKI